MIKVTGTTGDAESGAIFAEGAEIWIDGITFRAES